MLLLFDCLCEANRIPKPLPVSLPALKSNLPPVLLPLKLWAELFARLKLSQVAPTLGGFLTSWMKKIKMIHWAAEPATQTSIAPPGLKQASRVRPSHSHNFLRVNCRGAIELRKTTLYNVVNKKKIDCKCTEIRFKYFFNKINTVN